MLVSSLCVLRWRRCARVTLPGVCALLVFAVSASPALAQMGGVDTDPGDPGTGGKNTIQGSLFYVDGRRVDRRVKLRLRSIHVDQFTMCDETGAFSFRRLKGGAYTVLVDAGADFEPATETVDIIEPAVQKGESGQVYTISIKLQPRYATPLPVGTVDARASEVPDEALALYKQALDASQSGDRKQAIKLLNTALKIHPTYMSALNELGVQHLRLKNLDEAQAALSAALKVAPEAFAPRLNHGIVLLYKRNYSAARDELSRAVETRQSSAAARLYLGESLVGLGNYRAAEIELRHAVTIGGSESLEAHRYLGAVYIETGAAERAAVELETYLRLVPTARDADKIREIIKNQRAAGLASHK